MDPATTGVTSGGDIPAAGHGCVVLTSPEHGWEVLAGFIGDGICAQDQVAVVGLRDREASDLLRRLREEADVDPDRAVTDGQLLLVDQAVSARLLRIPGRDLTALITEHVDQALLDGYHGVRVIGLYPDPGIGPQEFLLNRLARTLPVTVLCAYNAGHLTGDQATRVRQLHSHDVPDTALMDDGRLRITRPRPGWLRLAGRWDTTNHDTALAVITGAVAAGNRDLDVASLRFIDPAGVHALLTNAGQLRLRRPTPLVQHLARLLSGQRLHDGKTGSPIERP